jgi:1-acyl-sn-glycerol-3-phosphate acyltransferase
MIFLQRIYTFWCLLCFLIPLVIFMPFFMLFHQRKQWHHGIYLINKIWAKFYFAFCLIPVHIEWRFKPKKKEQYIFCANHNSYLDIVSMGLVVHGQHAFVGKEALAKVPLFGYMFRRLHIPVKRESHVDAYKALQKMKEKVAEGKNIIIFPEGGIYSQNPPRMARLKDGAFRLAIETQKAIVPVTLPFNWYLLRDDDKFLPRWHVMKAIVHEPIETKGMSLEDLPALKKRFYQVIDQELDQYALAFERKAKFKKLRLSDVKL